MTLYGDEIYVKMGRRYKPIGKLFNGFPADGIWLVANSGRSASLMLPMDRLPESITHIGDVASFKRRLDKELSNGLRVSKGGVSLANVVDMAVQVLADMLAEESRSS